MRDPSIHVRESDLLEIMPEILKCKSAKEAVDLLFVRTKNKKLINRVYLKSNARVKKKVEKLVKTVDVNVSVFQTQLINYRKLVNHVRIKQVFPGDSEYNLLKEITALADEFVKDFELPMISGYVEFIKRGVMLMGRTYGLGKFKFYKTKIYEQYENSILLREDSDKKGSIRFYNTWKGLMLKYTGKVYELTTDDEKIHMLFGRQEADDLDADYKQYLESQFEGLAFMGVVPELGALYGLKAKSRYRKYMADKSFKDITQEKETVNSRHMTEDQIRYQEIRNRRAKDEK